MNQDLKKYVDDLFEKAPKTKAAYELKEEMLGNANERYTDLIKDLVPEKEALDIAIHSIGDVQELFLQTEEAGYQHPQSDEIIKKKALFKTAAIGIYILGIVLGIAIGEFTFKSWGVIIVLLFSGLATMLLVYRASAYPKYYKNADTMVEDFKKWQHNQQHNREIRTSINTILWMLVLILYFIISLLTGSWYITWVIFLIGICAQAIVNLVFQLRSTKDS